MSGYQFIHVEAYARTGSKQTRKARGKQPARVEVKWSASEIAAEAERHPGACDHVEQPLPPTYLVGSSVTAVADLGKAWGDQQRDPIGRRMRADAPVMLAGVVSLSRDRIDDWPAFRESVLAWLRERYGERLRCVIEHLDERHPHIHFYAVPLPGESFDVLHDGRRAAAAQKTRAEKGAAFKLAMRGYQDDFSAAVGQPFGLTRVGPRRARKTRAEWVADQEQADQLAEALESAQQAVQLSARIEALEADLAAAYKASSAQRLRGDKFELRALHLEQRLGEAEALLATLAPDERAELERRVTAAQLSLDGAPEGPR